LSDYDLDILYDENSIHIFKISPHSFIKENTKIQLKNINTLKGRKIV